MLRNIIILVSACILTLNSNAASYSRDFYLGYIQSAIDDLIPEEECTINLDHNQLRINIYGNELDKTTQQNLITRLQKKNYFNTIDIVSNQHGLTSNSSNTSGLQVAQNHKATPVYEVMPSGVLYSSPIADPRWPKFSAGYSAHVRNIYGRRVFDLSFGENLALLRYKNNNWAAELGIQAGLFGLMDIGSNPTRLINSDYFVGLGASFVYAKKWQNLVQYSHLSSHIGDEYIISHPSILPKRINLSYEAIKWFTAYKFDQFRPYLGFGYLMHVDPSYIKPLTFEGGLDYVSRDKVMFDTTRFIAGIHFHSWQTNQYRLSINLRTGLQFENPVWQGRNLQFLINYSKGRSRHGQFYPYHEHYIGLLIALSS